MTNELQTLGKVLDQLLVDPPSDAYRRKGPVCGNDTVILPTVALLDELITVRGVRLDQFGDAAQVLPFFAG